MSLAQQLHAFALAAGGKAHTLENRASVAANFARWLALSDNAPTSAAYVSFDHIEEFVAQRLAAGIGKRAVANDLSALRQIFRAAGRARFIESPALDTKTLGAAGASRASRTKAMPDEVYGRLHAEAARLNAGAAACIGLMRALGLLAIEAVQCAKDLPRWEKSLAAKSDICVRQGVRYSPNGAQRRYILPCDPARALAAVRAARAAVKNQGGSLLIACGRDGAKRACTTAREGAVLLGAVAAKAGFTGAHVLSSLRRAFAHEQFDFYKAREYSDAQAHTIVSMALGMGDAKGHIIARRYGLPGERQPPPYCERSRPAKRIAKISDSSVSRYGPR